MKELNIVVFGLSITSSWGNGHATTYRSLIKALAARGHRVTFYEKDVPWYANQRDLPDPPFCEVVLYGAVDELVDHERVIGGADLVILGSYAPDAEALTEKITALGPQCFAFYDIDTPVTLKKLEREDYEYLNPRMIPQFDVYLSFTGGPTLDKLEREYKARMARPLYCSVDTDLYYPHDEPLAERYALGYLGTYSDDRQPTVDSLLIDVAKEMPENRFCVAGAQYPDDILWPRNVETVEHIPPHEHRQFYNTLRFTLNVTRRDMIAAGYAPSVRLFEAGACGTPIVSDYWPGLDSLFEIGSEILVAKRSEDVVRYLDTPEQERRDMGRRLREKVLRNHTSHHRALELEQYWLDATMPQFMVSQG